MPDHPDQPVVEYRRKERPLLPPLTPVERRWRLKRYTLIAGLLLYAAIIALYVGPHEILFGRFTGLTPADFVPDVEQQGIPFVRAALAYKRDHGSLPANTQDLVPAYLPGTPPGTPPKIVGHIVRGTVVIFLRRRWNHQLTYDLIAPRPEWRVDGSFAEGVVPVPATLITPTAAPASAPSTAPSAVIR